MAPWLVPLLAALASYGGSRRAPPPTQPPSRTNPQGPGATGGGQGGPSGPSAMAVAGMATAAYGATRALEYFARRQMENAQELMRFNGAIAKSVLQLQRQEFLLKFRTAAATSGSTQTLSESVQGMNEALQPMKELVTNLKNIMASLGANIIAELARDVNLILAPINELVKHFTGGKKGETMAAFDFFRSIREGDFTTRMNVEGADRPPGPPVPRGSAIGAIGGPLPLRAIGGEIRGVKTTRPSDK